MKMNHEKLRKGIAAYTHEQAVLLRLLRRYGSFTERDFDRWFRRREFKGRPIRAFKYSRDSFLLGIGVNGFNEWATMLELIQIMATLGLVETAKRNGLVVYRVPAP